ncbi:type 1 glutamine amidotransferase [Jannaschia sp. Os4]|uniref:type 1 glutamine amidotransferase n=1 Tax=Jannaschia sp. Os4 TaxID=2807617 RepID=UPI001939EF2D|nr:type 1 glutamine amidotransferase [Jannaschia sp. Os4]MBM2576100.1 type 1 glutamine amidotransferase [Jannaschia sp. Os4]
MHIGILQAGHTPPELVEARGDFDAMFADLLAGHGFRFTSWDVERMDFPEGVHAAEGWLITGSKHGAYEDHPFIPPLEAFVRRAHAARVPLAGICFGHQIVAQAMGGRVVKFPGGWSVGRRDYVTADGAPMALNAWHQDQVVEPPETARTILSNAFCTHAALAYPHALTVQPHPEFGNDLIGDYVATRRGTGTYPDALMEQAARDVGRPTDRRAFGDAIARFFLTGEVRLEAPHAA